MNELRFPVKRPSLILPPGKSHFKSTTAFVIRGRTFSSHLFAMISQQWRPSSALLIQQQWLWWWWWRWLFPNQLLANHCDYAILSHRNLKSSSRATLYQGSIVLLHCGLRNSPWSCLIHHHLPPVASSATIPSSILLQLLYLLDCVSSSHAPSPLLAATSHGVIRIDIYSTDRPTTTSSSWNPLHRVKANHSKYVYGDHTHASSQYNVKQLAACGAYWRHRGECVEKSKYSTECGFVWMSVWRIFFAIIRPQVAANTYKWRRTILISKTHTGLHFTTRHEGYRI